VGDAVNEIETFGRWLAAWPVIRSGLGLRRNCCVQASIAGAIAADRIGLQGVEAHACRTFVHSPSSGRLVEYGVTDGVQYISDVEPDGYTRHAVIVGRDGFLDLTLDAHELVPGGVALDWGSDAVAVEAERAPILDKLAPDAEDGDRWAVGGMAAPGAFLGADEPIVATWELFPSHGLVTRAPAQVPSASGRSVPSGPPRDRGGVPSALRRLARPPSGGRCVRGRRPPKESRPRG
jgi:hypothetical protein